MTDQILKTNFKDLETMIEDTFLTGLHSNKEIQQKFDFIRTLLSAEEKSSDPTKPPHWHPFSQKLITMRNSFNERDNMDSVSQFTMFSNPEFDKDTISNTSTNSSCNCTMSCLNDDVGESGLNVHDDSEKILPEFVGEKAIVEFRGNGVDENSEKINVGKGKIGTFCFEDAEDSFEDFGKEKEVVEFDSCSKEKEKKENNELKNEVRVKKSGFKKNCCVLVSGVVIGMILMGFIMLNHSDCFDYEDQTSFEVPT